MSFDYMDYSNDTFENARVFVTIESVGYGEQAMKPKCKSPKDADPKLLWAMLQTRYKDGDEFVDGEALIWDVFRKEEGFVLYCQETKEVVEVPKPKLGG